MELERVVQLTHNGQRFNFRVDHDPPLAFWTVESAGRLYRSPLRVMGNEQPALFRGLAEGATREWSSS
jgi:hypothetical protein